LKTRHNLPEPRIRSRHHPRGFGYLGQQCVDISVSAAGKVTARGQVIAVRMPESMTPK